LREKERDLIRRIAASVARNGVCGRMDGVVVDGANLHDMKMFKTALSEAIAPRPEPDEKNP